MNLDSFNFYTYDIETMPNIFTFAGKFFRHPEVQVFEISTRKNERDRLLSWLSYLQNSQAHTVGFNNLHFDYQVLHDLLINPYTFDQNRAYQLAMQIIKSDRGFGFNLVKPEERILKQIDLYKINHFDNANKGVSLKSLQFAMRAESVEDLPIEVGTILRPDQMDQLIRYNIHDVTETERFLEKNLHLIQMRQELIDSGDLRGDVLNFSDTKIGEQYLIHKIGRAKCYNGGRAKQTFREFVYLKDVILPKIGYYTDAFDEPREWFSRQIIQVKGGEQPKFQKKLAGIEFFFGVGGVHASVDRQVFESNDDYIIKDVDVSGMYPAIATVNRFAPEHLKDVFNKPYDQLQVDRNRYKKGTSKNKMFKLAQNSVFGKADNVFSCFYDPKYPKEITVNGQLQLLQLAEMFAMIPGLYLIQVNTDGVTAYVPRKLEYLFKFWMSVWEKETGLKLEEVDYKKMWIRDVNNYVAQKMNGETKLKGAYWWPKTDDDYEGNWSKDFSMMIVQKVTEQCLVNDKQPEKIIKAFTDKFDFMKRYKTSKGAAVYIGETKMLKTVRYYVSKSGQPMKKITDAKGSGFKKANGISDKLYAEVMKEIGPDVWDARIHTKNKSKYADSTVSIESGYLVKECNRASDFCWEDVDWQYYIDEVNKLLI